MVFLKVVLIIIQVLTGLLLIGLILLQKSKDEGLGLAFGSAVGESLFGSRAGNILTKITVGLAIVFLMNTFVLAIVSSKSRHTRASLLDRAAVSTPITAPVRGAIPAAPAPDAGGAPLAPAAGNRGAVVPAPMAPVAPQPASANVPSAIPAAPVPVPAN